MNKNQKFLFKTISKAWKIIISNRVFFEILAFFLSIGAISFIISLTQYSQSILSEAGDSGIACTPTHPTCAFFEQCSTDTKSPTCQFNPNWRTSLTDDQILKIRETLNSYGIDAPGFGQNQSSGVWMVKEVCPTCHGLKNPNMMKDIIYATYPYLSEEERKEILAGLDKPYIAQQEELSGQAFWTYVDIITLPETLGTANALRHGAWNLIKNPKQIGDVFIKLQKIPEVISLIKDARSPARIAILADLDEIPAITVKAERAAANTSYNLRVESRLTESSWGKGFSTPIQLLSTKLPKKAKDAQAAIARVGGLVDYDVSIEVAATPRDFSKLYGNSLIDYFRGVNKDVAGFWDKSSRNIFLRPETVQYSDNDLVRLIVHETAHQVSGDVGFPTKVSKFMGNKHDSRVVEGWTEYITGRATDKFIDGTYKERVNAFLGFIDKYVYDYMKWKGVPKTDENFTYLYNWLDKRIFNYYFSESTTLERVYDRFYGEGKFGEILRWFFKDVSSLPDKREVANNIRNINTLSLSSPLEILSPQKVYASNITPCCRDWPDEGELKKPFIDALQTSQDLNISEWDTGSFEALLKLEWLKDRLNDNQQLTYEDFKQLSDLDFKVEVEKVEQPKFINMDDLPGDTSDSPFTPSPSFVPEDDLAPPDLSTIQNGNQTQEVIIGDCTDPYAWICEWPDKSWKNCLDTKPGNQSLFNSTYCNGELMWRFQAAQAHGGNGSECEGIQQNYKSDGCNN